jgi:hypothetical protein
MSAARAGKVWVRPMRAPWCACLAALVWAAAVLPAVLAGPAPAWAAAQDSRLPTTPAMREGMDKIRRVVIDHHTLITHRRLPPATAAGFNTRMEAIIAGLRSVDAAPSEPAAAFDAVLADLVRGSRVIAGKEPGLDALDGLGIVTKCLDDYGARFAHPGWEPISAR